MTTCKIYAIQPGTGRKYESGSIQKHYEMNKWLLDRGNKEFSYELYKVGKVHSIYIWKEKSERWGRTATPSNKKIVNSEKKEPCDRYSRKKARKKKAKSDSTTCRQPRG